MSLDPERLLGRLLRVTDEYRDVTKYGEQGTPYSNGAKAMGAAVRAEFEAVFRDGARMVAPGPIRVELGDTIEVGGQRFILVETRQELNRPATVTFKHPIELLEEKNRA